MLEGRCYERETVPYKALDGIVDALSRRLSRMSDAEVGALLPTRSATLAQVFPVLLRIAQVAKEHAALTLTVAPNELRQRAFVALRELFTRVAVRRPTVVVIDDLQWADDDGLRALAEILRPPDAPPLLLLGTVRIASGEDAGLHRLRTVIPGEPRVIDLASLGPEEARELAVAFLKRNEASDADPDTIANEAGGHPLFVEELARHVARGGSARDDVKLDDAIWSRILRLEAPTREMAELVAIAGRPIPQEIAAAAAHIEPAEFNRRAATLRVSNLVRTGGARWADAIEPYHDRVREAVFAQLTSERKRALHEALAIAFEASSHHDPETLATHWREAGNSARAARYAAAAGDQVSKAFAFDRAAQWYEQALELIPANDPGRRELRIRLGHALANAGRGALAAPHFEAAAAESPPMEALELRRRAADQLLRSGRVDEGLEASRQVLSSIGLRFPQTRFAAMFAAVFYRLYLAARGLGFKQRERGQVTAEELARIDTCMMLAYALSLIDPLLGVMFQTRALILALRAGELERVTRSVCVEAAFSGQSGRPAWRRTERLLNYAQELARRSGSLEARFYAACGAGAALYCNARCTDALPLLELSLELGQDGSTGFVHEQVVAQFFLTNALAPLGRFKELHRRQSEWLRQAIARGDIYGSVLMRTGNANLVWLMDDRPDVAEEQAVAAIAEWSKGGFHVAHNNGLLARIHVMLYRDDAAGADALARELHERARASSLWRVQITRLRALQQSCSSALLMVQHGLGDRTALLARASRDAGVIRREGTQWSLPFSTLVRAGIAVWSGAQGEALGGLDAAAREFEAIGMIGYALAARDRSARLRNDASTAADVERAAAFFRGEGVVSPERFIGMLVPGFAVP